MKGLLTTYRNYLPLTNSTPPLSLGEGDTPLVHAPAISRDTGADVWLKLEGCNPTGAFKYQVDNPRKLG
ncbi:MAG: pyridoxal-phosphate dependent enzyme [Chloroflexi bacterium]|nr:pyridoxal-phosphate dependent enzyme [Chloroflexota bacterium]